MRDRMILVQVEVAGSGHGHMSGHGTGEGSWRESFPQTFDKSALTHRARKSCENSVKPLSMKPVSNW